MIGGCSRFIPAPDGLSLHVVEYGAQIAPALPVVCLPGLARTEADFTPLAQALAHESQGARRVIAIDYRGRGRSAYDKDPRNYTPATELADLEAVLTALDIGRAVFVGTSRGSILTMLLAAAQPARIAGAVLNDIGPVIEAKGLVRIKGYVGKLPQPLSYEDAADILRQMFGAQFPKLTRADWIAAAQLTWRDEAGDLRLNYDPALARTLDAVDAEQATPPLWDQFDALSAAPLMVIRGTLSDILSATTVAAMRERRRGHLDVVEAVDEGHPPNLGTPEMIRRIAAFIRTCEDAADAA